MGAPGLTSPIRAQGFENLQLNAGILIKNAGAALTGQIDIHQLKVAVQNYITSGTQILGMTSGGGTFTITREPRLPEVDGRRYLHKGAQFVDSMDGYITSTLVEITPENWKTVIGTTAPFDDNTAAKAAYKIKTVLDNAAYLTDITWVGDLADGRFAVIVLNNALNTSDITFTFADKNEGKLPFELHAHQSGVNVYDTAPFRICFYNEEYTWVIEDTVILSAPANGSADHAFNKEYPAGQYKLEKHVTTSINATEASKLSYIFMNGDDEVASFGQSVSVYSIPGAFNKIRFANANTKSVTVNLERLYRTGDIT